MRDWSNSRIGGQALSTSISNRGITCPLEPWAAAIDATLAMLAPTTDLIPVEVDRLVLLHGIMVRGLKVPCTKLVTRM